MSILNLFKFSLVILFLAFQLTSCDKAAEEIINSPAITSNSNLLKNFSQSLDSLEHQDPTQCFALNYPVTVLFPDGQDTEVGSDEDLDITLQTWFQSNQSAETFPTFKFPIQVTLSAGKVQSVNNEDELNELISNCFDFEGCEYIDDYQGDIDGLCFSFNYPVTINFPDNTTQSVNSDSTFENVIEQWFMANGYESGVPIVAFPVSITLTDGTTKEIGSDEEFSAIFQECFGDQIGDQIGDDHEGEIGNDDDHQEECFSFVFPISYTLHDGTTITVNDEDELNKFHETIGVEIIDSVLTHPTIIYPITVALPDSTTQVIASDDEFLEMVSSCFQDVYSEEGDLEHFCFDISFPVTVLLPDGTSLIANNDDDVEKIFTKWVEENQETSTAPTFQYPITITKKDDTIEMITSDADFEAAIARCL
ncbi:MAG: hypothetical protein V3V00_11270 [Saprospiraceae bacterium]